MRGTVRTSFNTTFWVNQRGCLHEVVLAVGDFVGSHCDDCVRRDDRKVASAIAASLKGRKAVDVLQTVLDSGFWSHNKLEVATQVITASGHSQYAFECPLAAAGALLSDSKDAPQVSVVTETPRKILGGFSYREIGSVSGWLLECPSDSYFERSGAEAYFIGADGTLLIPDTTLKIRDTTRGKIRVSTIDPAQELASLQANASGRRGWGYSVSDGTLGSARKALDLAR